MSRLAAALAALLAMGAAAPAAAYLADNGLPVVRAADGTILVGARGGAAGRDFFCAAGDYARRLGAAPGSQVILLARPAPAAVFNGARTARFAVRASGGRGTLLTVRTRPGESMSVAHAYQLCAMDRLLDLR